MPQVTGANAGIGLAVTNSFAAAGNFVFLGSRSLERGEKAKASLDGSLHERVQVLQLDVTDDASVAAAAATVKRKVGEKGLDGLVNNAGGAKGGIGAASCHDDFVYTMKLNWEGTKRVTNAFLPLVREGGRVVFTSSGAAPSFVASCSLERKKFFVEPNVVPLQTALEQGGTLLQPGMPRLGAHSGAALCVHVPFDSLGEALGFREAI